MSLSYSVKSRFAISLFTNLLRSVISFITGLLLARWMGPLDYGRMIFLFASFSAIRGLLDMGSSTAFFTFLSQRHRSIRFVHMFWLWVALQLFISVLLITFLLPREVISRIWLGESQPLLILAFLAAFMQGTVWTLAAQMAEANRQTTRLQTLNSVVVFFHLIAVVLLWLFGKLVLPLIFIATIIEWALAGWLAARMYRINAEPFENQSMEHDTAKSVFGEFYKYCLPLIPYAWLSFAYDFADRWMLQNWGGATEQAYYGVALQFSGVALLATTSILRVFWKEIAQAYHEGNRQRVADLYVKVSRLMFFIAAAVAGGLLPWATEILKLTVGAAYSASVFTVMLMFIYPVHQSLGQIQGTLLYATGKVRIQVTIGMVVMVISMIVSYFMMAPADAMIPGFGLASKGLAWKMVILQIIGVNVTAWFITRFLEFRYDWIYQLVGLSGCVALGWIVSLFIKAIPLQADMLILRMCAAGCIYVICLAGFLYVLPWVAGTTRDEIKLHVRQIKKLRLA